VKFEKLFVAICFKVASIIILWRNEMSLSRRQILKCIAAAPLVNLAACSTAPFGSKHSYLSQIIKPQNQNTVFHWIDVILQQIRDQRITPPRAAYNLAMPMVAALHKTIKSPIASVRARVMQTLRLLMASLSRLPQRKYFNSLLWLKKVNF
jgi:hypothetical protein